MKHALNFLLMFISRLCMYGFCVLFRKQSYLSIYFCYTILGYNTSEKHTRIVRSAEIARYSPCQDSVELLAKGLYCLDLFHQNVSHSMKESSLEGFCRYVVQFVSIVILISALPQFRPSILLSVFQTLLADMSLFSLAALYLHILF